MGRSAKRKLRWLLYATNGFGLGHVSRTLAVARELRKRTPEAEFLFLTNSEAANLIWDEGFASVKLPSKESWKQGGLARPTVLWLNHALVLNTFSAFRPDIVLVDSFPVGWAGELSVPMQYQPSRVLIYREKQTALIRHPRMQELLQEYDLILATHPADEIDPFAPKEVPVEWVGPMMLRSNRETLSREQARHRLGLPETGMVISVGFGGGGDKEYRELVNWVLKHARNFPKWTFALVVPPLSREKAAGGAQGNVHYFRYFPLADCLSAFDGAISALGYNTTMELLHHGVPTLFVPRVVKEDDHPARARRIAARGAGWIVAPFDDRALAEGLLALADPEQRNRVSAAARQLVPDNGAAVAAERLVAWSQKQLEGRD